MSSISHSMTTIALVAPAAASPALADADAQHVRRLLEVAVAGAVADALDAHRRQRAERRRVAGHEQRAGRRHQFRLRAADRSARRRSSRRSPAPAPETRRAPSRPFRRRHSAATTTMRSTPNHSSANTAPTMSMIESSAPTSCRWTWSIGISWIAASASRQPLEQLPARVLSSRPSSADRRIAATMLLW